MRRQRRGLGKPETFAFLGFTFISGKSRRGAFQLQRKTRRDRMRAKLREIKEPLRVRMHHAIPEQGQWLKAVVMGFVAYHAVSTNARALDAFRHHVTDPWRRTLRRRSQKTHMTWQRMTRLAAPWLPPPRILHPWPVLPILGKDIADRLPRTRLDHVVGIQEREMHQVRRHSAHAGFARAHEPDECKVMDGARVSHNNELAHPRRFGTQFLRVFNRRSGSFRVPQKGFEAPRAFNDLWHPESLTNSSSTPTPAMLLSSSLGDCTPVGLW